MSNIPLHKERGLDPHMAICPRCNKENGEITVGHIKKAQMPDGRWVYASAGDGVRKTQRQLEAQGLPRATGWVDVEEREKVPSPNPCKDCAEEMRVHAEVVKKGGVYFRCEACATTGVIKAESKLAVETRKQNNIEAPDPCGIAFENCAQHGGKP